MFRSRTRWISALIVILAVAWVSFHLLIPAGGVFEFLQSEERMFGMSYFRGYCAGMAAARRDLADNKAVIATFGEMLFRLDASTGLPLVSLGCVADRGIFGYTDGYDRLVELYVQWKGLPRNSRKRWEYILQDPAEYFRIRSQPVTPLRLVADAPPILASDGKTRVALKAIRSTGYKNKVVLHELNWGLKRINIYTLPIDGTIHCLAGPPESDFIVVRCMAEGIDRTPIPYTYVLDLRYECEIKI
jgi:hypothetical protein